MSGQVQVTQVESQDTQVEQEYHGEEKCEYKSMYVELLPPKFNTNLLTKTYVDNLSTGSVRSGGGDRKHDIRSRQSRQL